MKKFKIKNVKVSCPLCDGSGEYTLNVKIDVTPAIMKAMREAGVTLEEISRKFQMSIGNVHYILNKIEHDKPGK